MSQQHSSLGALAADHSATGSHSRRAVPRSQVDPPEPVLVPYRVLRARELKGKLHVGALSPGDFFVSALTQRIGMVAAHDTIDVSEPQPMVVFSKASPKYPMGRRKTILVTQPRDMQPVTVIVWGSFDYDGAWKGDRQQVVSRNFMVIPK